MRIKFLSSKLTGPHLLYGDGPEGLHESLLGRGIDRLQGIEQFRVSARPLCRWVSTHLLALLSRLFASAASGRAILPAFIFLPPEYRLVTYRKPFTSLGELLQTISRSISCPKSAPTAPPCTLLPLVSLCPHHPGGHLPPYTLPSDR